MNKWKMTENSFLPVYSFENSRPTWLCYGKTNLFKFFEDLDTSKYVCFYSTPSYTYIKSSS